MAILRVRDKNGKVSDIPAIRGFSPHIGENGNWWIGEEDTGYPVYPEDFEQIRKDVAALKGYHPIAINRVYNNVGTVELGMSIGSVTINWELNKDPVSQTVNGQAVENTERSLVIAGPFTAGKSFAVTVTDAEGNTASKSTSISFYNGVYYGALDTGVMPGTSQILELTKKLQSGRSATIPWTPASGKRPTYACPTRYGTPKIVINNFEYSWVKLGSTDFTNDSGYTEKYDVWQHPQDVTESLTITVS